MIRISLAGLILIAATACAQQPAAPLERTVHGQVLTSPHTPALKIEFGMAFKYAGGQTFVLYDVANAEQHFFVDADGEGRLRRLYWVQFEGYLPSNTHRYSYKSESRPTINGLEFFSDAAARSRAGAKPRAGSDGERARELLESKGYRLPEEFLWQRLVHLTDASRRSELMIVYSEDLASTGLTAADLAPRGRAADKWPDMAKALLDRARAGLKIRSHH